MKTRFGEDHATSRADACGIDAFHAGRGRWLMDGVRLADRIDRDGLHAHGVGDTTPPLKNSWAASAEQAAA